MSSSPRERGFSAFLVESLQIIRAERGDIYIRLCAKLAPRLVRVRVGDEVTTLAFAADEVRPVIRGAPSVDIESDRTTILAVIDGESTLADAVLAERLKLRGACEDLLAFHDGFLLYVHGAVRAPSLPQLLRDFRHPTEVGATARRARLQN